jgi:hypothetical protein
MHAFTKFIKLYKQKRYHGVLLKQIFIEQIASQKC